MEATERERETGVLERRLKLSMNPRLIDKNAGGDTALYAVGFLNIEVTLEVMAEGVAAGIAYAPQMSGPRAVRNFLASDLASVDIDKATSIDEMLERELIKHHASLVYTTASHTSAVPRARAVFVLPRTITNHAEMAALNRSLALRSGGDLAATDAARICFGARGARTIIADQGLTSLLMDELIKQSLNTTKSGAAPSGAARSLLTFPADLTVRLAGGSVHRVSDLPPGQRLHCPFHADEHPSAFTVRSGRGINGIHCAAACAATFWPERTDLAFDFYSFGREARRAFERQATTANAGDEA